MAGDVTSTNEWGETDERTRTLAGVLVHTRQHRWGIPVEPESP